MSDELPPGLVIQSEETDSRYPFLFSKLCNINVPFETGMPYGPRGAYIDIFPLMWSGRPNRKNKSLYHLVLIIGYVLQVKSKWCHYIPYKEGLARFVYSAFSLCPAVCLKKLRGFFVRQICASQKDRTTLCSIGGAYKAEKEFYPEKWFSNRVLLTFEKDQFWAPIEWEQYLARNYGNYMELPPRNERKTRHKA